MLHKYDKIEDAMAACISLEFPLIVGVHNKLTSVNTTGEATHNSGTDGTHSTFSFLPALHSADTMGPSSGSNSLDADTANKSLGYLLKPVSLMGSDAVSASVMAEALADGEELAIVPQFPLGSVQGGAAQREALLVTLLESRLSPVTVLHLIEEGTPDYAAFSAAFLDYPTTSGSALLRVHIFYPPRIGLTPTALSGSTLTPQSVHLGVHMCLLRPPIHLGARASGHSDEVLSFFTTTVSAMNREYKRTRQQENRTSASTYLSPGPNHHTDPNSTTTSIVAVPAQRAKGSSNADTLNAAHLIRIAGLPMSFTITATNTAAHKTIFTTPNMTLQTVWRAVEKHLEWAQREMQQAQAASTWNGITPPKPTAKFKLTIEASSESPEAGVVTVTTPEEAAGMPLQDYPRNTVVQVHFEGVAPPTLPPAAAATPAPCPTEYVCKGDACRRRVLEDACAPDSASTAPPPPKSKSEPAPSSATVSAPASVKLRCSLPDGRTLDLETLDPTVATLRANVRPSVEEALGRSNFLFVCAYPPRRYSPETDEPLPLKDVGLGQSCALRVVLLDGPVSSNAPRTSAEVQQQSGHTRQLLFNAASSLMGMFSGARGNHSNAGDSAAATAPSPPDPRPSQRHRRTYNSMAEILAANEEAERQTAIERLRQEQQRSGLSSSSRHQPDAEQRAQGKKCNRYFGGGSTEFIAEDGPDEAGDHDEGKHTSPESLTAAQQEAFLCEQLKHLMNRYRRQSREAGDDDDEDAGNGIEKNVQGGGVRGGHHAFQGQGRRLADDAPPASSNSADAATSLPSTGNQIDTQRGSEVSENETEEG